MPKLGVKYVYKSRWRSSSVRTPDFYEDGELFEVRYLQLCHRFYCDDIAVYISMCENSITSIESK